MDDMSPDQTQTHTDRLINGDPPPPHDQPGCYCYPCRRWFYERRRNRMLRQEPVDPDDMSPK